MDLCGSVCTAYTQSMCTALGNCCCSLTLSWGCGPIHGKYTGSLLQDKKVEKGECDSSVLKLKTSVKMSFLTPSWREAVNEGG